MQRLTVFTDDMIMGCFFKLLEREKKSGPSVDISVRVSRSVG